MTTIAQHVEEIKRQFDSLLNGRIEAGQALALTGHVKQLDASNWLVDSQSEPGKSYPVSWADRRWCCTCKDHTGEGYHPTPEVDFGGGTQATCKHIIAAALVYFSDEPPAAPVADLVIVTRRALKFAGHSQSNDGKILWWKLANAERVTPRTTVRLSDSLIQAKLQKYELVKQDCATTEIWHYYKLNNGGAQ